MLSKSWHCQKGVTSGVMSGASSGACLGQSRRYLHCGFRSATCISDAVYLCEIWTRESSPSENILEVSLEVCINILTERGVGEMKVPGPMEGKSDLGIWLRLLIREEKSGNKLSSPHLPVHNGPISSQNSAH